MTLPRTVRIHGVRYRLRFVDGKRDKHLNGRNTGAVDWGASDPVIKIDSERHIEEQRETLLHELIHIVGQEIQIPILVSEETVTGPLARFLYGIFRDNAKLARWLIGDSDDK